MFYNIENAFQLVFECWKCIRTLIQPCSNDSPSIKHWRHHLVQINIFNVLATVHFKYRSSLLPVFLYLVIFIYSSMSADFPFSVFRFCRHPSQNKTSLLFSRATSHQWKTFLDSTRPFRVPVSPFLYVFFLARISFGGMKTFTCNKMQVKQTNWMVKYANAFGKVK